MQRNYEPELIGITREDIQQVLEKTMKEFKEAKTRVINIDASYIYTFELDDFQYTRKLNLLMRYDKRHVKEWHKLLERWYNDQTVRNDRGYAIKPIAIERTLDRVVNEGLEYMAEAIVGSGDIKSFDWRAIGKGVSPEALPSDKTLLDEVDRIDVLGTIEGGSLSNDGSTVYSVGNHSKTVESCSITECGMFNTDVSVNDVMFEHSIFPTAVPHTQNADAPGSTTVIYMCSS
jgi:hypothetical protein